MKTTTNNYAELDTNILRRLALMQSNGEHFFTLDGVAYEGEESAAKESYEAAKEDYDSFVSFCNDTCVMVDEMEADDEICGYICLTDEEADEKAAEYIKESLWAFNASFLSEQTGLDAEIFEAIQANGKCEDNNDTIYNTINKLGDMEDFIQAAISADGRGHFMNTYDGREDEETVNGETFYIYRMN